MDSTDTDAEELRRLIRTANRKQLRLIEWELLALLAKRRFSQPPDAKPLGGKVSPRAA